MITYNGKQYARNVQEFTNTLFESGNTANGFYKQVKNGIKLYNMQKELIAFIKRNMQGEPAFIVSASNTEKGDRFMFSTTESAERYLGIEELSYTENKEQCQTTINQLFNI